MIVVETDRIYSVYVRQSRRIKWQYADYNGRWETPEKAVQIIKERYGGRAEYLIQTLDGETVATGFINV